MSAYKSEQGSSSELQMANEAKRVLWWRRVRDGAEKLSAKAMVASGIGVLALGANALIEKYVEEPTVVEKVVQGGAMAAIGVFAVSMIAEKFADGQAGHIEKGLSFEARAAYLSPPQAAE